MTGREAIRLQLVDDHEMVRDGFRHLLEKESHIRIVAESASGKEACRHYEQHKPDIVIIDISLPDMSGIEVLRRILRLHPDARALMLSMHSGMVAEFAVQLGARGFICKSSGTRELAQAVQQVMSGGTYLDPAAEIAGKTDKSGSISGTPLTKRELEICLLLVEGRGISEIAKLLHLSEKTVYTHRQRSMKKLAVSTPIELTKLVERMGLHRVG